MKNYSKHRQLSKIIIIIILEIMFLYNENQKPNFMKCTLSITQKIASQLKRICESFTVLLYYLFHYLEKTKTESTQFKDWDL